MRRPSRNIEIFSMSVLDMFASALGAFIMITVILFPSYNKVRQLKQVREDVVVQQRAIDDLKKESDELKKVSDTQAQTIQQGNEARSEATQCNQRLSACLKANAQPFLVIGVEWDDPYDLDMYVTDPAGREFYYSRKTFDGSTARLSLDMRTGPGIEVWQDPKAMPGAYSVSYRLLGDPPPEGIPFKAWVVDRSGGRRDLPSGMVTSRETFQGAQIVVSADGGVTIQGARGGSGP